MFVLPNWSSCHADFWYNAMGGSKNGDPVFGANFAAAEDLQRRLSKAEQRAEQKRQRDG